MGNSFIAFALTRRMRFAALSEKCGFATKNKVCKKHKHVNILIDGNMSLNLSRNVENTN